MKNNLIFLLLLSVILLPSCAKEDSGSSTEDLSVYNITLLFKMIDHEGQPAWDDHDMYLNDSTQSPHWPFMIWENGEITALDYRYRINTDYPHITGPHFFFEDQPELFGRVLGQSQDSIATAKIVWNKNQIDTLSIHAGHRGMIANLHYNTELIKFNNDTIYEYFLKPKDTNQVLFQDFGTVLVKIKTSK